MSRLSKNVFQITGKSSGTAITELARRMWGGGMSSSGINVTAETAMQSATVYSCVQYLANGISVPPCITYERVNEKNKRRAFDYSLYSLLHDAPNNYQTSKEFREMYMTSCLLRGYFAAFKNVVRNEVRELLPIHPDRITIHAIPENSSAPYDIKFKVDGQEFSSDKIFYVRGLTLDGIHGITPIKYQKETIGLDIALKRYGGLLFRNGANHGGIIKHPGKMLDEKTAEDIKDGFVNATSGENAHRPAILFGGMEWEKLTMTAEDSQFIQSKGYTREEIAAIFGVKASKINDLTHGTYTNLESEDQTSVNDSLMPWAVRFEQNVTRQLIYKADRGKYFTEILFDGILRGNLEARYKAYGQGINWGIINPNEAREKENLNPYDGGDDYLRPVNMTQAGLDASQGSNDNGKN